MSKPDHDEFAQLLRAHAGRTLTLDEDARLRSLAGRSADQAAELHAIDELHQVLDGERALFEAVMAPVTTAEEADEGYTRLLRVAAHSELSLRDQLSASGSAPAAPRAVDSSPREARRRGVWLTLAAVAAALALALLWRGGPERPALLPNPPDDSVLGGAARIVMLSELHADRPELSWHTVLGAARYEARIVDATGKVLLARQGAAAAAPRWEFSAAQFAELRALSKAGDLRLRVIARDGAGIAIGTTGDLPLRVVD